MNSCNEEKPKRAASAYLFYAAERRPQLKATRPELGFGELTHTIAEEWKAMTDIQKQKYIALAEKDKIRYDEETKKRTIQLPKLFDEGYVQFSFRRMTDISMARPELTYGERLKIVIAEWSSFSDNIKQSYAALDRAAAKNLLPSLPQIPATPAPMILGTYNGVQINAFLKHLGQNPDLTRILIDTAKFFADKHSISEVRNYDNEHECDDCYSGDTEYEMTEELLKAGPHLAKIYREVRGADLDDQDDESDE